MASLAKINTNFQWMSHICHIDRIPMSNSFKTYFFLIFTRHLPLFIGIFLFLFFLHAFLGIIIRLNLHSSKSPTRR